MPNPVTLSASASSSLGPKGAGLDPAFAEKLAALLKTCRDEGYVFRIGEGLRTPQTQAKYYCRWDRHPPEMIDRRAAELEAWGAPWLASVMRQYRDIARSSAWLTNQLPGSGWHQWGLAADCYCFRDGSMVEDGNDRAYKFYADQAVRLGLRAGYYFRRQDSGHVQDPSADGASVVFQWPHIDAVMKERFEEKHAVALRDAPAVVPQRMRAAADLAAAPQVPPEASAADIHVQGNLVFGPGNIQFGRVRGPGLIQIGKSSVDDFFHEDPDAFPDVPAGHRHVIQAVLENEGKIEAINTYDNAFLSVGPFQWTAGPGTDPGELAGLLDAIKTRTPNVFQEYFGKNGLDVAVTHPAPLTTGFLVLNSTQLNKPALKGRLRDHLWAYRFWRAAHDREIRRAYMRQAMERVAAFYGKPVQGRKLSDWITSECGVALILDEHVNRPGHVPGTIGKAIKAFVDDTGKSNPANWRKADEMAVLDRYLDLRANTNMTDSVHRGERILARADSGLLSRERGSYP
jgi:hypothetical protein